MTCLCTKNWWKKRTEWFYSCLKNSRLPLRGGQAVLRKKSKYIMWYYKKTFIGLWNFEA